MKARAIVFVALLLAMLATGTHMLFSNLRKGVLDPEPAPAPIVQQPPFVVPYSVPETREPTRTLVEDDVTRALKEENAALKERVHQLETARPTTRGELAVVLGVKEADLTHFLDRSELLPDATKLAEAVRIAGAGNVWAALQTEAKLYRSMADFKAKNPCEQSNRVAWHSTRWVPFLATAVATTCDELYRLSLPSTVVEPFRNRLNEGI